MRARRLGAFGAFDWPFVAAGNLVTVGSARQITSGPGYKGFPFAGVIPGGDLLAGWRHGTTHSSEDGFVEAIRSSDLAETFGAPFTIYDTADDVRDPSLTVLSGGGLALSVFRLASGLAYQCEVLFSSGDPTSWGTPVVVSKTYSAHTYDEAACSAPVVEVSPGHLILPTYMHDGASNWNAFAVHSTDSGASFPDVALMATGGGKSWVEPWIVRRPSDGFQLAEIRVDNLNQTWQGSSSDDGASWSISGSEWAGDSRNATILTQSGALFTTGRNGGIQGQYGTSWDFGATPWETRQNLPSPSSAYMYGAIAQISRQLIVLIWSQESNSTTADIWLQMFLDTGP